jgi:hypothetical protein
VDLQRSHPDLGHEAATVAIGGATAPNFAVASSSEIGTAYGRWSSPMLELLKASYESTSEMKIFAPPLAKFGMSLGAACPSFVDRLLCSRSMSSKYISKIR